MYKYKLIFLLSSFCFFSEAIAQFSRQRTNFDKEWKFHLGNASLPEKDFNYSLETIFAKSSSALNTAISPSFVDSSWDKINLPHDWAVSLPFTYSTASNIEAHGYKPIGGAFPATSIGWYRKHFYIPKSDSGKRLQLQFDGIFRDANVWINGYYLGNNKSGYIGADYDLTDFINYDKDNVIVVRVDATQFEGWFYEGAGIYRHSWLNKYDNVHIATEGVYIYSTVANQNATVSVETTIANEINEDIALSLRAYLTDREGHRISSMVDQDVTGLAFQNQLIKQTFPINHPILWTMDNPYLYRIVVEVLKNGKLIDAKTFRFGIRSIEIKTNGVFLNGKPVKIQGTNNHQDHAGLGTALPDRIQYYRIELLKKMGANAFRTSHGAASPELLDACDSLGMLVLEEQRLMTSSKEYLDQFERMVKRDRNRTCLFMWSIGNEEGGIQTTSQGKRVAQTFINTLQKLDPTRTCTYAADLANVYQGVNEVIPVRGFNYRQFAIEEYHRDHPGQPIIGTEMGSTVSTRGILFVDTLHGYLPDQDITAPLWASKAEDWWKLAGKNDYWLGGFIWTGFDYRGEPTPFSWPNINSHFGVMDMCGFPKNIYYYYQSWWSDKDVLHISPHWNWKNKKGDPIEVWVNSNADTVELFLNGKSLGKKNMPYMGHLQWTVNFTPGRIEAVGYKNGHTMTSMVETTGEPYKIMLRPDRTSLLADGNDVSVINVSVTDLEGREVPDASNLIRFSVEGDAKIIGVGNGDPSSHEMDKCPEGHWQRSLFNGKCQVILQSGVSKNTIRLTAVSDELLKVSSQFNTYLSLHIN